MKMRMGAVRAIVDAFAAPALLASMSPRSLEDWLRVTRQAGLLGRFAAIVPPTVVAQLPTAARRQLAVATRVGNEYARMLDWEIEQLAAALRGQVSKVVLLKGAAYFAEGLPFSAGRYVSDVDLLVAEDELPAAEAALRRAGWIEAELTPYDERYYRQWMHELPPLRHRSRNSIADLHHTILPPTGRLHPDAAALLDGARPVGEAGLLVLDRADQVLHCCAHLVQDGDLNNRLREVFDLHGLLVAGMGHAGFADSLAGRAQRHRLERPLDYGLHLVGAVFGTSPLGDRWPKLPASRLNRVRRAGFLALARRAIEPVADADAPRGVRFPRWLLYVRSHWLRMPPLQLAAHLTRKGLRRGKGRARTAE
ncbi:MAG: nucleotidyltransferase family protein [Chromatiales bacterium]|nr:nucleotidyltransferase family protein [Chromatiales bacterium]